MTTPEQAFQRYEDVKARLPENKSGSTRSEKRAIAVENLGAIEDQFDVFLFDAFGVLNVGDSVLPEAPPRLERLQELGKQVYILTNSASFQKEAHIEKFQKFGFAIEEGNIVSSREVLLHCLQEKGVFADKNIRKWGIISVCDMSDWPAGSNYTCFDYADSAGNRAFWEADAFVFLSSANWTEAFQQELLAHLKENPRPVFIGNPDIVAPREDGLSLEPGYFAHQLMDETRAPIEFFGKPFGNAFEQAIIRAKSRQIDLDLSRVLMLGDTLHTDILGGNAAGISTALITNYGTYKGKGLTAYFEQSGIVPDYVMPTL